MKADAVFEGGGVKGIGLVGAVAEIEKAGYEFVNLAGTSAGAEFLKKWDFAAWKKKYRQNKGRGAS